MATAFAQIPVGPGPHHAAPHHVPVYNYEYAVQDDKTPPHYQPLKFGQTEHRDGYVTKGSYHVLLPDGRIQTVTYSVDGEYGGYVADVSENSNSSVRGPYFHGFHPFQVKYEGVPHYGPPVVHAPHHGKPHV